MTVTITALTEREFFAWYTLLAEYAVTERVALDDEHVMRIWATVLAPDAAAFVAHDDDDSIVGLIHATGFQRLMTGERGFQVEDVFVSRDARRGGIGTALVEHLREHAARAGRPVRWPADTDDEATHALQVKFEHDGDTRVLHSLSIG